MKGRAKDSRKALAENLQAANARAERLAAVARAGKRCLNGLDAMCEEGLIVEGSYDYLVTTIAALHDGDMN